MNNDIKFILVIIVAMIIILSGLMNYKNDNKPVNINKTYYHLQIDSNNTLSNFTLDGYKYNISLDYVNFTLTGYNNYTFIFSHNYIYNNMTFNKMYVYLEKNITLYIYKSNVTNITGVLYIG